MLKQMPSLKLTQIDAFQHKLLEQEQPKYFRSDFGRVKKWANQYSQFDECAAISLQLCWEFIFVVGNCNVRVPFQEIPPQTMKLHSLHQNFVSKS